MIDTKSILSGELLNEHQASQYLNVSVRSLQAWRLRGGGPKYAKLGRSVRYRRTDLDHYVVENLTSSTSEVSAGRSAR